MNECGVTNFQCLHDLATATNLEMKTEEGIKRNIGECLVPSCVSMEIVKVGETDSKFGSTTTGSVKIEVVNMPTLRYVRRVTFTKLDMIGEFIGNPNLTIFQTFLMFMKFKLVESLDYSSEHQF